jgi:ABC-2 type transport system permease protein
VTEAVAPVTPVAQGAPAGRDAWGAWGTWAGLPDALHAEWTKLRTLASTWWLLLAAAALTVGVGAAVAASYHCAGGPGAGVSGCAPAATGADPARISLTGVDLGQVVIALLAVLAVGGEYGTGMIRVTLAATPRRLTVLAAKVLVVTGWALAAALVAVAGSLLAGRLILPGRGLSAANGYVVPTLLNGADLRAFGGSVLYLALIALLALGVTTAVRDSGVAIGLVLGLLFIFPILAAVVPSQDLSRHLEQIAPMNAGLDIQATVGLPALPLTPWQGLGVAALWATGALILGAVVLRFRDA